MKNKKGKLFTTTGEDIWRMVEIIKEPTVAMENLTTGKKSLSILSQAESRYIELIPARELPETKDMDYVPPLPSNK